MRIIILAIKAYTVIYIKVENNGKQEKKDSSLAIANLDDNPVSTCVSLFSASVFTCRQNSIIISELLDLDLILPNLLFIFY